MQLMKNFILLVLVMSSYDCTSLEGAENYSLNLMAKVAKDSPNNIFLSVGGLLESISLLYEASAGATNAVLRQVTNFSPSKTTHHADYYGYKTNLMATKGVDTTFLQKSIVFRHEAVPIYSNFQEIIQKFYQCNIITIPKGNSEREHLRKIHQEIDLYTNHTLDKSFIDSVLSSLTDTELMIISTNHFKSTWESPFDPLDTKTRAFNNLDGTISMTPFMEGTGRYKAHRVLELRSTLIQLPFLKSQFSLLILLPDEYVKTDSILDKLNWDQVKNAIPNEYAPMSIVIPKFKLDTNVEMNDYLIQNGLADLFKKLDLSSMTPEKDLSLSSINQISHFEIDESGTTASSSIHMTIGFRSLQIPKIVLVNRPFLFFIINSKSYCPIYLGKIVSF